MATITQVICDKCRSHNDVTTVDWEIGRETGQIDLCSTCLRRAISDVTVTHKDHREPGQAEVRAWARDQGLKVPAKGRIPLEIMQKYSSRRESPAPALEAIS